MIELKNIQKSFEGKPVLRDVNITVNDGESVVLLGRSGSGKSVTLRHILGLMQPDGGDVFVDGIHINNASENDLFNVRRKMGMLFQNAALWDSMNVFDNVALPLQFHKIVEGEALNNRVHQCLSRVGLGDQDIATRYPSELSGGMRKRVGLARAIATEPKYMLYDEPTTGLDPIMSGIIDTLIRDLNREMQVTSLTITHDMNSAFTIADRIIMLHRGEILFEGKVKEFQNSEDPVIQQFIKGNSEGPVRPIFTDHYEKTQQHQ